MVVNSRGIEARSLICDYIAWHVANRGYPPTIRDISNEIGLSVAGVHYHLRVLTEMGVIEHTPGVARGVRLVRGYL